LTTKTRPIKSGLLIYMRHIFILSVYFSLIAILDANAVIVVAPVVAYMMYYFVVVNRVHVRDISKLRSNIEDLIDANNKTINFLSEVQRGMSKITKEAKHNEAEIERTRTILLKNSIKKRGMDGKRDLERALAKKGINEETRRS
jgi:low affinity Fe/Cu permease